MNSRNFPRRVTRKPTGARLLFASLLVQTALPGTAMAQENVGNGTQFYTTADPVQVGQPVELIATAPAGLTPENSFDFYGDTEDFFSVEPLCVHVSGSTIGSQWIAHCTVTLPNAGTRYFYADVGTPVGNMSNSAGTYVVQHVIPETPFDANQFALTGAWYNTAASSQGLILTIKPDFSGVGSGYLFAGWPTYDANGNPRWYILQGGQVDEHGGSYALGIYGSTGGGFNAATMSTTVAVGTASLRFYDCNHAALSYAFLDGRSGTSAYIRLTNATACSTEQPATQADALPEDYADVMRSGAWYDREFSSQGLQLDIVPSQHLFFASWLTYAPASNGLTGVEGQRWFTLQRNDYTPGATRLTNVPILTTIGIFNGLSEGRMEQVGRADITFTSCRTMTIDYQFTAGEFKSLGGTMYEEALLNGCP